MSGTWFEGKEARGEGKKMDAHPGSKDGGGDGWGLGRFDNVRRDTMMSDGDPISGQPSKGPSVTITETEAPLFPKRKELPMMFYFVTSYVMFLQGLGEMSGLAVSYFYKNTLGVSPATLSTMTSLAAIPWTIKPLYGFLSDGWPIMGYRRKPYLIIAGVMGSAMWFCMAIFVNDIYLGFFCMFFASMAVAVSNVIAEGMVVERSRGESQEFASHLQATIHGAQAVGGIIAAYFGGFLLAYVADRHMFMLCALFPATMCLVAMWAPEQKFEGDITSVRRDMNQMLGEVWAAVMRPEISKPLAFVFLLNATPATGATWFYFYTNVLHFTSSFLGTINVVGAVCSLGGVLFFGSFLANAPFRPILIWSTLISTIFGLSQLALVFGWNKAWGIPDGFFCLGESAILSVLGWINTMPILVLAARLCPPGMEATMYAVIMSVSNLGGVLGTQFGALLTWQLGITDDNLENFWILVLICNVSTVIPLLLIGWVPANGDEVGAEMSVSDDKDRQKAHAV